MRWAVLVPKSKLPSILLEKHTDWPALLRWVPRRWTAWLGDPPRKLFGNATLPLQPVPAKGEWYVSSPLYIAFQTRSGWYFRLGFRWDDVDHYFEFPAFTLKKY